MEYGKHPYTECKYYSNNEYYESRISSFFLHNIQTGTITHLFDAPCWYRVNDFKFVTLVKKNGTGTEDFCCFCGTAKRDTCSYWGISPMPGDPAPDTYLYKNYGFAGFFSMTDALSPTPSCTRPILTCWGTTR